MLLEVLNFLFVLLGLFQTWECPEIPLFASRPILLARIEPVFPGFQFANHAEMDAANGCFAAR